MTRKGINSDSVLRRQRPVTTRGRPGRGKNRTVRGPRRVGRITFGITLAIALLGGAMGSRSLLTKDGPLSRQKQRESAQKPGNNWKIQIVHSSSEPLSSADAKEMIDLAQRHLGTGTRSELAHLAKLLQQASTYSSVHISKTSPQTLAIRVVPRLPLVCIEADRLRYVDRTGAIYGSPDGLDHCPGPVIKGLFETQRKFALKDDATLDLSPEELNSTKDALNLVATASSLGHEISSIQHAKYLGFSIKLRTLDTEIAVGHKPFENQFKKLGAILDQVTTAGHEALRIDLDYQGKAFIKLRKI